jgi:hypothetical protein
MKTFTALFVAAGLALAQEPTRITEIQINEPVLIAGVPQVTLQPGKYVFRILKHEHTRNIVQVFDTRNNLITTALAINNYRLRPTDKTSVRFWETPKGNPPALRAWFAPGDEWGQEFVYPKGLATTLARDTGGPVLTARATTEAELSTAPVTEIVKSGEEKPLEEAYTKAPEAQTPPAVQTPARAAAPVVTQAPERAPAPAVVAQVQQPAPAAAPATNKQEAETALLPATGSPVFAIGLGGLLMAALGFALRHAVAQRS